MDRYDFLTYILQEYKKSNELLPEQAEFLDNFVQSCRSILKANPPVLIETRSNTPSIVLRDHTLLLFVDSISSDMSSASENINEPGVSVFGSGSYSRDLYKYAPEGVSVIRTDK